MLPKKAISTFISALNSRIPPPVHTAGIEDSRPVPAVLIENMSINEKNYHNSHYAGSGYDGSGNVTSEIFRHYYDLRLELTVRDDDEVDAFNILGTLKQALAEMGREPQETVHPHLNVLETGNTGEISYQFYEPTETEINQTVVLKTFYESENADPDVIDSIGTNYNFS